MEFTKGDVVILKSDSNALFTVGEVFKTNNGNMARIYWFDHTAKQIKSVEVPVEIISK